MDNRWHWKKPTVAGTKADKSGIFCIVKAHFSGLEDQTVKSPLAWRPRFILVRKIPGQRACKPLSILAEEESPWTESPQRATSQGVVSPGVVKCLR